MTDQNDQNSVPANDAPPAWAQAIFERIDAMERGQREAAEQAEKMRQPAQPKMVETGYGEISAETAAAVEQAYIQINGKPLTDFNPPDEVSNMLDEVRAKTRAKAEELGINKPELTLRERILNRLASDQIAREQGGLGESLFDTHIQSNEQGESEYQQALNEARKRRAK